MTCCSVSRAISETRAAARQLAMIVEKAWGDDAKVVGGFVRDAGAIELLIELLGDESARCTRCARCSANLSSDAVDPDSAKTKALVVQQGGVEALAKKLEATDWVSQMYAAAAVQNLSQDASFATALAKLNGPKKRSGCSSRTRRWWQLAAGALKNRQIIWRRSVKLAAAAAAALAARDGGRAAAAAAQ